MIEFFKKITKYFIIYPTDLKGGFKFRLTIPIGRKNRKTEKENGKMGFWENLKKLFKKTDDLRERIEDAIAEVLDRLSENELLDRGEEAILNTALGVILEYAQQKSGKTIRVSDETKKAIVTGITNGNNRLQKKIAEQLRK